VCSGALVFSTFPNTLALAGIALIVLSGIAVVFVDVRKQVPVPAETPVG
jgi:hypothetical protein